MIIAVAGRRIDAKDSKIARFPLARAELVKASLRCTFREFQAHAIVASAACGADLLALSVADEMGIPYYIVLPYAKQRFKQTSVTDRPGDWGKLFDRLTFTAKQSGKIITLHARKNVQHDHEKANQRIFEEVMRLQHASSLMQEDLLAIIVWDGKRRSPDDITAAFAQKARQLKIPVHEIPTIS